MNPLCHTQEIPTRTPSSSALSTDSWPGVFVVFEGIDGTGKSTQVRMLREALERAGETPVVSREPTDGPWGRKIRESATTGRMSLEEELAAFLEDRTEHVNGLILPALHEGRVVILDRYYYSSIAYQGARGGNEREIERIMTQRFPRPDVVLLLDIDPAEAVHRIANQRGEIPNEFERLEGLERSRRIFLGLGDDRIVRIRAGLAPQVVHREVVAALVAGPLRWRRPDAAVWLAGKFVKPVF
ncbi:MAG: dTMP kinase [Bryobacteraceae bacterium]